MCVVWKGKHLLLTQSHFIPPLFLRETLKKALSLLLAVPGLPHARWFKCLWLWGNGGHGEVFPENQSKQLSTLSDCSLMFYSRWEERPDLWEFMLIYVKPFKRRRVVIYLCTWILHFLRQVYSGMAISTILIDSLFCLRFYNVFVI